MTTTKPQLQERPPIIVVMGHVDHGKSSLLDYIRKTNTIAGEAGGITQHVAAYEVIHESAEHGKKRITFIDTPGHAAFSAIRARGANVADIAILVVSAEEGVKEQTLEALRHIQESNIPFVIAINKIDKSAADIERTKISLLEHEIVVEGYGGSIPWVGISAKTGVGISDLLDTLLLVAALEEFKGDVSKPAEGFVLEAHRDSKRGIAATLVITDGSLKYGMAVRAGLSIAPLRIMEDHAGKALREAQFSTPITITGFDDMPEVGSPFITHENKKVAEAIRDEIRRNPAACAAAVSEESSDIHTVPFVVKADAAGSLEAVMGEIAKLANDRVRAKIVHNGIGIITEGDIKSAVAAGCARVIGFNVVIDAAAAELARDRGVEVEMFNIIYRMSEWARDILTASIPKQRVEESIGRARTLKVFSRSKEITVLGGKVFEGQLRTEEKIRVMRRGEKIGEGFMVNIQVNRQNTDKVDTDYEFGAQMESSFEIMAGDTLECYRIVEK